MCTQQSMVGLRILVWCATATLAAACSLTELPTESLPGFSDPGGGTDCAAAEDCNLTGTDCLVPSCVAGTCTYTVATRFTPIDSQKAGDCQQAVCDGEGSEMAVSIDDPFDDGNECTIDTCDDGTPVNSADEAAACNQGAGWCSSNAACAECLDDEHCEAGLECADQICVPPSCTDDKLSVGETDIDCGGNDCGPCGDLDGCAVAADCISKVCTGDQCQIPACDDEVQNGDETDLNCGGDTCAPCADGEYCEDYRDCVSKVCSSAEPGEPLTCAKPTCSDGIRNGAETGIDCGSSSDCGPCGTGQNCDVASDCASLVCDDVCLAPACNDGVQNGSETGVDCGGADCNAQCIIGADPNNSSIVL